MTRATDERKSEWHSQRRVLRQEISAAQRKADSDKLAAAERGEMVLDLLKRDGGTQSRAMLDGDTITAYTESYVDGVTFPAIVVFYDGKDYWLADGFHRVEAAIRAGLVALPMDLHQGTQRDAILYSVGANATHGLRRTNADKRRAVTRLLNDDEWSQWSDSEIARRCVVSQSTVSRIRSSLMQSISENSAPRTYITRHGTPATMNTGNIGKIPGAYSVASAPPMPPQIKPALPDDVYPAVSDAVDTGQIGVQPAIALDRTLKQLPDDVQAIALSLQIWNADKLDILHRLYTSRDGEGSNATFDEIAATGGFHYGNDLGEWLNFSESSVQAIGAALRTLAKAHAEIEKQAKLAAKTAVPEQLSGDAYQLYTGDFAAVCDTLAADSVDVIFADPPYGEDALFLYGLLSRVARRLLKPGGSLLVMTGQTHLPRVLTRLEANLTYHWTLSYLTPGGQSPHLWQKNVNSFWKPVLWFVKDKYEGDWQGDVIKSAANDNDKSLHQWQQSLSGMNDLIQRYTYPDQLVLDPMCGSGTTGIACVQQHRRFIGIDNDPAAIATAAERLASWQNKEL